MIGSGGAVRLKGRGFAAFETFWQGHQHLSEDAKTNGKTIWAFTYSTMHSIEECAPVRCYFCIRTLT